MIVSWRVAYLLRKKHQEFRKRERTKTNTSAEEPAVDIHDGATNEDSRDEYDGRGRYELFADGPSTVPEEEGISSSLRKAVREPEFVSLLERMAVAYRASPAKFDAVRTVIHILLGIR